MRFILSTNDCLKLHKHDENHSTNLIQILFKGDLKDELDKEKESQTSIKRKIEEETKTTGRDNAKTFFIEINV